MTKQGNSPSPEELALLAAQGNDDAMAQLIAVISPIARARAAAIGGAGASTEDLIQEGMFGFLDAVRTFRADKEASFCTYANTCISNRIISAVRSSRSQKNLALSSALPLTEESVPALNSADPQEIFSDKENSDRIMRLLANNLSSFELSVIRLRLMGESYAAISAKLGRSEKAVDNALQRVKVKLRKNK